MHCAALLAFVDECLDRFGADERPPVLALVDLLADRIREYEDRAYPWPDLPPHEPLRELMTEHGIKQGDMPEVATQSVHSEILAGKRAINLRQAKALAARFGVPMEILAA